MTPEELRSIGERLYGPRWQTSLARALPVNPRTIRSWLSGKRKMRPVIAERVRAMDERQSHMIAEKNV
jgi:hypothetical protein